MNIFACTLYLDSLVVNILSYLHPLYKHDPPQAHRFFGKPFESYLQTWNIYF